MEEEFEVAELDKTFVEWLNDFARKAEGLHKVLNRYKEIYKEYYLTVKEYHKLANAIRKHRDQKGDDRCWMDDEELYRLLPEGYEAPKRDSCVELKLCEKFIATRHNPNTEYVSPERRIEELEKQLEYYKSKQG